MLKENNVAKSNVLVVSRCRYSSMGLAGFLERNLNSAENKYCYSYAEGKRIRAETLNRYDIVMMFTFRDLKQNIAILEIISSMYRLYNGKTKIVVFYDDERVVQLFSILGARVELISAKLPLNVLLEKVRTVLHSPTLGQLSFQQTRMLSAAERQVIFNLLKGISLQDIAKTRGTNVKTIFAQKYSAMKKLRLKHIGTVFTSAGAAH
ncbi:LuxR family transcriptional regulator [Affinibrenneria salicis]|uniref:LuxR family transcriptional regulator n=1 Tax=Affinibrenneria salicis TaxID=2590031 RepID=A0A5J5G399_9GAMM|nr:LuxR family transcriptional regulator [Affinibrenneria salicis]KAA9001123.1 LuxR family transcriptional regulator [Affinibrenneria salicis]